jgi:TPP-dependent pyruvate/acetoin dehydrogenase alpha subunit
MGTGSQASASTATTRSPCTDAVKEMVDNAHAAAVVPGWWRRARNALVGHYYGDMQSYRPKGEIAEAMKVEPIVVAVARLVARWNAQAQSDQANSKRRVRAEIQTAAETSPLADPMTSESTVMEHLYA